MNKIDVRLVSLTNVSASVIKKAEKEIQALFDNGYLLLRGDIVGKGIVLFFTKQLA